MWRSFSVQRSRSSRVSRPRRPPGKPSGISRERRRRLSGDRRIDHLRCGRADLHDGGVRHEHVGHARRVPVRVAQDDRRLHRPRPTSRSSAPASIRTARSAGSSASTLEADSPYVDAARPRRRPHLAAVPQDGRRDHRADRVDGRRPPTSSSSSAEGAHLHHVGRAASASRSRAARSTTSISATRSTSACSSARTTRR